MRMAIASEILMMSADFTNSARKDISADRPGSVTDGQRLQQLEAELAETRARLHAEEVARRGWEREAADIYDEMFRRNTAPKLLIDPDDGAIVDANPAALAFYGYTQEAMRELRIQDINQLSEAEVRAEWEKARREQRRYFEFRHRVASGDIRDVKVYSGPVVVNGRTYLHSIIHDVTDALRYRESLERHKAIFDTLPVGVYRNRPGPEGHFEDVNPAMARIFGAASVEELLRHPTAQLYRDPRQRLRFSKDLLARGEVQRRELDLLTLDGQAIRAAVTARMTHDAEGRVVFDGIVEDVSERHEIEQERARILEILEATSDLIGMADPRGKVLYLNAALKRFTGGGLRQLDWGLDSLLTERTALLLREVALPAAERDGIWEGETVLLDAAGREVPVSQTLVAHRDEAGKVQRYSTIMRDISASKAMERELERLATHDPLTGLYNRAKLYELLEAARRELERYEKPFSVIMLDIDHFKRVNDRFGHQVGDEVLCELTSRVNGALRETDVQGRWGGEEFMVLATHTDIQGAAALAERLRATVARTPFGKVGSVTISLGVAACEKGEPMERLEERVDQAMYRAKQGGRNRVALAGPTVARG